MLGNSISFVSNIQTRVSHCGFGSGTESLFCLENSKQHFTKCEREK